MKFLIEVNDLSVIGRSEIASKTEDVEALKVLADDESVNVKCNVAKNSNVTSAILQILAKDKVETIKCLAIKNYNMTIELLKHFILYSDNVRVATTALKIYYARNKK